MSYMFYDAHRFNQNIGRWDVSSVRNMDRMFYRAILFNNGDLYGNENYFNQNTGRRIGQWNVSLVTNMKYLFYGAEAFDKNLCGWADHNFPYSNAFNIFSDSGCNVKSTPSDANGNFCQQC